jgi:hypothetical protein
MVPAGDNSRQGVDLREFYKKEDVRDGENFLVVPLPF